MRIEENVISVEYTRHEINSVNPKRIIVYIDIRVYVKIAEMNIKDNIGVLNYEKRRYQSIGIEEES